MTTTQTRRAILAGIATAPAAALAAPALALSAPDPIFAAIENNRKADAEFIRLCSVEDELEERGIELVRAPDDSRTPEMVAVVEASIETRKSLAKTAPTTLAGLVAYIGYVRDWSPDDYLFADDDESRDFLDSLQRAVRGLSAGGVS
jgi:hypothetical protein